TTADSGKVMAIATNSVPCTSDTAVLPIKFLPTPTASFSTNKDTVFLSQDGAVEFTNNSSDVDSFEWDFGDSTTFSGKDTSHQYSRTGLFNVLLTVTDSNNCSDSTSQIITVTTENINNDSALVIPNVFTPNNDGKNDIFKIGLKNEKQDLKNAFSKIKISIYNRWGERVWKGEGIKVQWQGRTIAGEKVPQGQYIYTIKGKWKEGDDFEKAGSLRLLR
ncbi:MAG: gliding motility-associated C-terminal domain-containing protein, partial [Flavobacteriales bacterium]